MLNIKVKIVSQTKELYNANCTSITLPTSTGQITILPNHFDLITLLDMGQIILKQTDNRIKEMLINGGTASFANNELTILTEDGVASDELIKEEIDEALKNASEHKSSDLDPTELIQLEKQLRFEMFKKNFLQG
ncbi:ATP synthase F1 subunit epsilon [candidate division WWE3 bacterium CG08_land_8_20_14_0_20_41_10]|uniref:ATP synthase epsilon chain n=1 Tax=candidate division WWE3 bacterium CG08_land_8_20_14_0_20_41_10 TaxID=1975085 RepID=A0A2H0XCN5_UNCKA|nr:MAG: ATP synthase F1 subunit epsilon [candidate division WWE3 bacterium CG08_land_8_20_14_0_20_41_10]